MEVFIGTILDRLFATSVQTIALTSLVWLLCRLVPRLSPVTQGWLWWLVALQGLAGLALDPIRLPWLPVANTHSAAPAFLSGEAPVQIVSTGSSLPDWQMVAFLLWITGVVTMLAATAREWRRARRLWGSSSPCTDSSIFGMLSTASAAQVCAGHRNCGYRTRSLRLF